MRARLVRLRFAFAGISFSALSLAHAAGTLDPTFANGPTLVGDITGPSIAVSPDGRIAIAGTHLSWHDGRLIPDGKIAVFDNAGQLHATFGKSGVVGLAPSAEPSIHSADAVTFDALGRVLVSGARLSSTHGAYSVRLRADGHESATYANGSPGLSPPSRLGGAFTLAIDHESRILVGGTTAFQGSALNASPIGADSPVLARLNPDGTLDTSFGIGGQVVFAHPGSVRAVVEDEQNGLVVVSGGSNQLVAMRLSESGTVDTGFGVSGQTGMPNTLAAAGDAEGRTLAVIINYDPPYTRVVRLVNGILDGTFGSGGEVKLPEAGFNSIAVAPDGSVFVGTADRGVDKATLRIVRVRNDGVIDLGYGYRGEAAVSFDYEVGGGSDFPTLAVDREGRLVVAVVRYGADQSSGFRDTRLMLYRFTSASTPAPDTATAIEYHHASFDHYFVTTNADEIAKIDAGVIAGWTRTGESFTVQTRSRGDAMPVCRFFTGATFAPRSSHFYTPYPSECDTVDAGPAWEFEKLAFFLTLPVGAGQGNGSCPSGTVALFRAFNAMRGGAPNHRYTTRASTLDAMIAQGWFMEGEANTRVFACVPQ